MTPMRVRSAVLGTAVLTLTAAPSLPAQAAPAAGPTPASTPQLLKEVPSAETDRQAAALWVHLRNTGTQGKFCLSVPGADRQPGVGLVQFDCGPWVDHWWTLEAWTYQGQRVYRIVSQNPSVNNTSQCVAIPGGSMQAGVQAIQWECGTWLDHFWKVTDQTGAGDYQLRNLKSDQCLGVDGNSHTAGAKVIQWPCKTDGGDHPDHRWHLSID
ncbi:RICIN domain-containing protein [Streptomyces sp. SJL17-4]|uniref:RICIN domain-containing protein n=1 Tax=Streptomyces sp. SJL17-4 TaxID=2967224 RepID=UPI0030D2F0B6